MNVVSLSLDTLLWIHAEGIRQYGGIAGVRDRGLVESALAQPFASYAGIERFPTLPEKVAALGYFLIRNHGFLDGNKRVGFAAMDVFARVNGYRLVVETEEAEQTILAVASNRLSLEQFTEWVRLHLQPRKV